MSDRRATFYYDLSSPYAYLAALRVDDILPVDAVWQPIAFGALIREIGKVPWSMRDDTRAAGQAEIAERARERGLPDVRWPPRLAGRELLRGPVAGGAPRPRRGSREGAVRSSSTGSRSPRASRSTTSRW